MSERSISLIEDIISRDVGRGIDELARSARGGLFSAASSIAGHQRPKIGIITGFYIPHGTPPAAENDGPLGTAHMLAGFIAAGFGARIATDGPCVGVISATVAAAGFAVNSGTTIDIVAVNKNDEGATIENVIDAWTDDGITHVIAIERCGKSADGKPRNARGDDISAHTAPLDDLFLGHDGENNWETIAIGDGGNEIGMGSLDPELIGKNIKNGAEIACVTPANHLIVAGVSNWGAWGLLGAIALLLPQKKAELTATITPAKELEMLTHINQHGPSIDGMSGQIKNTVDGLDYEFHANILKQVMGIVY